MEKLLELGTIDVFRRNSVEHFELGILLPESEIRHIARQMTQENLLNFPAEGSSDNYRCMVWSECLSLCSLSQGTYTIILWHRF